MASVAMVERLIELRERGYTLDEVAITLFREGLAKSIYSKVYIRKLLIQQAPHLLNSVRGNRGKSLTQ